MEDSSLDTILPGWGIGTEREAVLAAYAEGITLTTDRVVYDALVQQ